LRRKKESSVGSAVCGRGTGTVIHSTIDLVSKNFAAATERGGGGYQKKKIEIRKAEI